jgi:hypothetical protein
MVFLLRALAILAREVKGEQETHQQVSAKTRKRKWRWCGRMGSDSLKEVYDVAGEMHKSS